MLSNILYRILSKGCPNLAVAQDISSCRRVCEKKLRPKHHKTGIYAWSTSGISRTRRGERLAQEDQTYYYSPLEAVQDFLAKNCNIANSTPRTEGVFPTREKTIFPAKIFKESTYQKTPEQKRRTEANSQAYKTTLLGDSTRFDSWYQTRHTKELEIYFNKREKHKQRRMSLW